MSRALLDSNSGEWAAVIPHGDRERLSDIVAPGLHFAELHPHKADGGISLTIDGRTVGHLGSDLLHYHRPLSRLIGSGVRVLAECRVGSVGGREGLLIPYWSQRDLDRWVGRQITSFRRYASEQRRAAARAHSAVPRGRVAV